MDDFRSIEMEIKKLSTSVNRLDSKVRRYEALSKEITETRQQVARIKTILLGDGNGKEGIDRVVERILIVLCGNKEMGITGLHEQVAEIKAAMRETKAQKNMIRGAVIGVLIITALGNTSSIVSLVRMLLFP